VPKVLEDQVIWRAVLEIRPAPRNARKHGDKQIAQLARAIAEFGFAAPILVDETGTILAGHARLEAAKRLSMTTVPTLCISGLTAAQKRAYAIADNRLAELAGWDEGVLRLEFADLIDLGFEVDKTGFEIGEIDLLITDSNTSAADLADDRIPAVHPGPAVTRPGDLWLLGGHRLLCANALDPASYLRLMDGETAGIVITDPPYNVPIDGHVSGLGAIQHREFAMAVGEMTEAEFTHFLATLISLLSRASRRAAMLFICMDWRHLRELLNAAHGTVQMKNLCVWAKENAGMGSLYRSQHELVGVFQNGPGKSVNNVQLGGLGRYRTNVWSYPGMNSFQQGRDELLEMHPTVKPVALVADAILDCSRPNDVVLDPFMGSGTTILAAERTRRRAFGIEIDPTYIDVAIRRWQERTNQAAVLHGDGRTFDTINAEQKFHAETERKDCE